MIVKIKCDNVLRGGIQLAGIVPVSVTSPGVLAILSVGRQALLLRALETVGPPLLRPEQPGRGGRRGSGFLHLTSDSLPPIGVTLLPAFHWLWATRFCRQLHHL